MEFTVNRKEAVAALSSAMAAVETRTTIPILGFALVEASGDRLTITTSDLELSIRTRCGAKVKTVGKGALPAKKLLDYLKALPEDEVSCKYSDANWLSVTCGPSKSRMAGLSPDAFPEIPSHSGDLAKVSSIAIRQMAKGTIFAIAPPDGRYTLPGARWRASGGRLEMTSTDGHRVAQVTVQCAVDGELPAKALLPRRFLQAILGLSESTEDESIGFAVAENFCFASDGTTEIVARKMDGNFPDIDKMLDRLSHTATFSGDAKSFSGSLGRVRQFSDEDSKAKITRTVELRVSDGRLTVTANSVDSGEAEESFAVHGDGSFQGKFNPNYLIDFFRAASAETVTMKTSTAQAPIELSDGAGLRYIVVGKSW